MSVDAVELAKYIIDKCTKDGRPVSNLQLQKILYFLFQEVYKEYGLLLFPNKIEMCAFGPMIPDIHRIYGDNGRFAIYKEYEGIKLFVEPRILAFIDKRVVELRDIPVWSLVEKSQVEGLPIPWRRWGKEIRYK